MNEKNNFSLDLKNEEALGKYLDKHYLTLKGLSNYTIERKTDILNQKLGIDLLLIDKITGATINVDEKAQLHYLNKSLKTFTFEISYFLNTNWKKGWFYDQEKTTRTYFLITCIQGDTENGFTGFRLIRINRQHLQKYLFNNHLTEKRIFEYEKLFRSDEKKYNGNQEIKELSTSFATFHCSFNNLRERPINLKIKLQALLDNKLAVELHSCSLNN